MLIFSLTEFSRQSLFWFRTHVVATTVCTTGSVHTHTPVARTFFYTWRVHSHIRTSSGSLHMCHISPSRLVLSHVSPNFGCLFTTTLSPLSRPHVLAVLLVLKAQDMRISARGREVWLSGQVRPQQTNGVFDWPVEIVPHNARTTGKNGNSGLYSSLSELEQIEDMTITIANSGRPNCLKRTRQ